MAKIKTFFWVTVLFMLVGSLSGFAEQPGFRADAGALFGVSVTTSQQAVFAAFLSDVPPTAETPRVSTAISVSNVLADPFRALVGSGTPGGNDTVGTLEYYLYDRGGTQVFWESDMDPSVGLGLNEDGTLGPGQTHSVLLRQILDSAGYDSDQAFNGYGWVVANFDGVAGTYNVTIFGLGFTSGFEFLPGFAQSVFAFSGVPVSQSSGN